MLWLKGCETGLSVQKNKWEKPNWVVKLGGTIGELCFTVMPLFDFSALGGDISLLVSQPNINSSLAEDVLLSVAYTGETNPVIEWKHTSMAGGTTKIAEWKTGFYANISSAYKDRVSIYENGSLQLLKVDLKDSGYYLVTVRDELGIILYGTILLNVHGMA